MSHANPDRALRATRLAWAMMIVGELMLAGGIVARVLASPSAPLGPSWRPLPLVASVGLLGVVTPLGLFIRNQTYKANWRGHAVSPAGYVRANLILFVLLAAVVAAALVMQMATGLHGGLLGVAAAAMLVQLANFPTGRPMQPRRPSLPEVRTP